MCNLIELIQKQKTMKRKTKDFSSLNVKLNTIEIKDKFKDNCCSNPNQLSDNFYY